MPTRTYKPHNGTVLSTVEQTLLQFSGSLITGGSVFRGLTLTNTGSTPRLVTVYFIPQGQVAATQYIVYRDTVGSNSSVPIPGGPWYGDSAAFVQAKQDAGTDVVARCNGCFEEA